MASLVIAEHNNQALNAATLAAVAAASKIGGDVHVLVAGQGCAGVAQAAFVEPAFALSQRGVGRGRRVRAFRGGQAAVVRGKDDPGVVGEVMMPEGGKDLPDGPVNLLHHIGCVNQGVSEDGGR